MAKKRKAPGAAKEKATENEDHNKRVRLNVNSYEDVADSDDEFHIARDKVLLEEAPAQKRSRKIQEQEEFLEASDEEVLGYSEEDEEDEEEVDYESSDAGRASEEGAENEEDGEDEEDEINEWGTSKQDYYGADEMQTEQDALDEEAEAKRLQQKQLASMKAADYGFDEDEWAGNDTGKEAAKTDPKTVTETLPRLAVSAELSPAERLKMLKTRFPEFEPLSKEFLELQSTVQALRKQKLEEQGTEANNKPQSYTDGPASGLDMKERAASAYLGVLAMYFALLTSEAADTEASESALPTNVRDHPIMDALLSSRELWSTVKDLPDQDSEDEQDSLADGEQEEMEGALKEVEEAQPKRERLTKAQKKAAAVARSAEALRAQRMMQAEEDLADLDDLLVRRPKKSAKAKVDSTISGAPDEDSDFGETELSEKALADKAAKRKSLRFYTSQITQKSNKRGAAGRSAGGDDDIPHRERLRDRQARLTAEAARKGQNGTAGDALGGESDEEDHSQAQALRAAADADLEGDDYYQYIANKTATKKAAKEDLAAARKEALLNGGRIVENEIVGEDGKRKISYAIEKNKGLTPHRKKDVRNPRVKKRKKFEASKKKLSSMKATYKGGEGRGGYAGELTGIKSNLVRSRKL